MINMQVNKLKKSTNKQKTIHKINKNVYKQSEFKATKRFDENVFEQFYST